MKKIKRIASALAALAAAAALAVSSGAYLTVAENPSEYLNSDKETWQFVLPEKHNDMAVGINKIELVVTFDGDATQYNKEKTNGSYDNEAAKPFADFEGYIGIGARVNVNGKEDNWYSFNYKTLNPEAAANAPAVKKLNSTTYLFSCAFTEVEILPTERDIQLSFKDWANKSDFYALTVREFYAYLSDGTVAIYADENGNAEFGTHAALDLSVYTAAEPGVTTEVTTEATTEATTTAAPETTIAAVTTTAAASETTAAAAETNAAETTKKGGSVETVSTDYSSRDSSLLIVGIVAGVLIIGVVVGIILYMRNKKKRNHWREGL